MARITFTQYGSNTAVGNFEPGTKATVGEALAAHFVALGVARYDLAPYPQPAAAPPPAPKRRRKPSE